MFASKARSAGSDQLLLKEKVFKGVGIHTWTVPKGVKEVDVFLVGGGGGGSNCGGGGGYVRSYFNVSVTSSETVNIIVGDGGDRVGSVLGNGGIGNNGENSSFGGIIALGGGGGGSFGIGGRDGGSGGGAGNSSFGGLSMANYGTGNAGGNSNDTRAGGGGGGIGGSGGIATGFGSRSGGDGGRGVDVSYFSNAIGINGRIGGGGGGGEYNSSSMSLSAQPGLGVDGGGIGQRENPNDSGCHTKHDGVDGAGSGGGGASGHTSHACGGAGGSGVVAVKYQIITHVYFEWGEAEDELINVTSSQITTSPQTFSQTIEGLEKDKTYYYRAVAENEGVVVYGEIFSFVATDDEEEVVPPTVRTNPITRMQINEDGSDGKMALSGTLLSLGGADEATVFFQWGTSLNLNNTTREEDKTTSEKIFSFSEEINIFLDQTYYYRAVAENSVGISYGNILSFDIAKKIGHINITFGDFSKGIEITEEGRIEIISP